MSAGSSIPWIAEWFKYGNILTVWINCWIPNNISVDALTRVLKYRPFFPQRGMISDHKMKHFWRNHIFKNIAQYKDNNVRSEIASGHLSLVIVLVFEMQNIGNQPWQFNSFYIKHVSVAGHFKFPVVAW